MGGLRHDADLCRLGLGYVVVDLPQALVGSPGDGTVAGELLQGESLARLGPGNDVGVLVGAGASVPVVDIEPECWRQPVLLDLLARLTDAQVAHQADVATSTLRLRKRQE